MEPTAGPVTVNEGRSLSWPVRLSTAAFAENPSRLDIDLPGGETVTALRESWLDDAGTITWSGRVIGASRERSSVTLSVARGRIAGVVDTDSARYLVAPTATGHAVERSTGGTVECSGPVYPPRDLSGAIEGLAADASGDDLVGVGSAAGQPKVNILILFTPSAAGVVGNAIQPLAAASVGYLNRALDNSLVQGSARLAGAEIIDTLDGPNGLDEYLDRLRLDPTVASRRAATSADIVQLFVGFSEAGGGCGLGYVMGRGDTSRSMARFAFGASAVRCSPEATFAHEVGHNLGLNHNPEDAGNSFPFHSWAFGHRDSSPNEKTVMSYGPQREVPYFSNPEVSLGSGFVTGVANERDNARTLAETMSIASGFVGSAGTAGVPAPTSLTAVLEAAGMARLNWVDPATDETGFRIDLKTDNGSWRLAMRVGVDVTTALIDGLAPGHQYRFRVRTERDSTNSTWSNVVSVETSSAASAPATITALPVSETEIEISWSAAQLPSPTTSRLLIQARSPDHGYLTVGELPDYSDALDGSFMVTGLDPETPYTFIAQVDPTGLAQPPAPSEEASATTTGYSGECRDDVQSLCLQGGRFEVRVAWNNPQIAGDQGVGTAIPIAGSQESGMFWFFGAENVELVVKMLDASGFTGTFWHFYGALSDVEYWISTRDTVTDASRTYHNPPTSLCGRGDINAFPGTTQSSIGAPSDSLAARWQAQALSLGPEIQGGVGSMEAGSCVADETTLCFAGARFSVKVDFTVTMPQVSTGVGGTLPALNTADTGFFWFFQDTNVELAVKVLDARVINDRFWLFWGALSDVEYHLTVTDTTNDRVLVLDNPAGSLCGGSDIDTLGAP